MLAGHHWFVRQQLAGRCTASPLLTRRPHTLSSPSVPATAGAYSAHACTSGSYNDPKGYMSFRLFDLPSTYFNNLAYVPPNIRMQLLPVADDQWSSLGKTTRVKNGFVCLSSSENILRAMMEVAAPGLRLNVDSWPGGCGDGEWHQLCLFRLYRHCSSALFNACSLSST